MKKTDVIMRLRGHAAEIAARGVTGLHLFGSTAEDTARAESDVDLFLDHVDGFSLFDLADLADRLEDLLGARVDLTTRDGLDHRLRAGIEARAERVL